MTEYWPSHLRRALTAALVFAAFLTSAACAFARKQAKTPSAITDADVQELVRHFGQERALDVIWWACRCHYMIRVADAFQLPLERDNVFMGMMPKR